MAKTLSPFAGLLAMLQKPLLLAAHPVGSYYWSSSAADPGTLFGGTWVQVKDRFVLAAGDTYKAGSTGGAASVTSGGTALRIDNLPSRSTVSLQNQASAAQTTMYGWHASTTTTEANAWLTGTLGDFISKGWVYKGTWGGKSDQPHTHTVATMPPYIVAYCWRRTA